MDGELEAVFEQRLQHTLLVFWRCVARQFLPDVEPVHVEPCRSAHDLVGLETPGDSDHVGYGGVVQFIAICVDGYDAKAQGKGSEREGRRRMDIRCHELWPRSGELSENRADGWPVRNADDDRRRESRQK